MEYLSEVESLEQLQLAKNKLRWGSRPINRYRLEAILKFAGKRVLDAGCGNGAYVRYLCHCGYDAYGFDLVKSEIRDEVKSCFFVANILYMPFKDNTFDTILAFEVLEHIEDVDLALAELYRVAKKNIIISVPDCQLDEKFASSGLVFSHWIDRTHRQTFTKESLKQILMSHGFSIELFKSINPVNPDLLFFYNWGMSIRLAKLFSRFTNRLHLNKLYMTLLAVVSK